MSLDDIIAKIDFGDAGKIFASGTEAVASDDDADCTISVDKDDFIAMAAGDLDPMMAFMSGKLKVAGDMSGITELIQLHVIQIL